MSDEDSSIYLAAQQEGLFVSSDTGATCSHLLIDSVNPTFAVNTVNALDVWGDTLRAGTDSGLVFIGPSPEAIHEFPRQCVEEDLSHMLSRHLGKPEVEQVTELVTRMFDAHKPAQPAGSDSSATTSSTVIPLHPRNRHLH